MSRLKGMPSRFERAAPRMVAAPKQVEGFYQSAEWRELMRDIKRERGNACQRCGATGRIIGDHIVERRDGGPDLDRSNIELLCLPCHNRKTSKARARRAHGG